MHIGREYVLITKRNINLKKMLLIISRVDFGDRRVVFGDKCVNCLIWLLPTS